jgi:small-conductance mechanosensitive channel
VKIPPAVSYSVRRIGLFVATLALCAATLRGVDPIVVLLVATLVSAVLSYVLLAGAREQMARSLAGRVRRIGERLDAGAAKEDAALDAASQAPESRPKPSSS